jgi:hypothetical protein
VSARSGCEDSVFCLQPSSHKCLCKMLTCNRTYRIVVPCEREWLGAVRGRIDRTAASQTPLQQQRCTAAAASQAWSHLHTRYLVIVVRDVWVQQRVNRVRHGCFSVQAEQRQHCTQVRRAAAALARSSTESSGDRPHACDNAFNSIHSFCRRTHKPSAKVQPRQHRILG